MRNLIGGVLAAFTASVLIVVINIATSYVYPEPFIHFWFILDGPHRIDSAFDMLHNPQILFGLLVSIGTAGVVVSLFSQSIMNSVRTSLWMGVALGSLLVASVLLIDPSFWTSADRNVTLLVIYIQNILVSLVSLISAVPLVWLRTWITGRVTQPLEPPKIETRCECGAVFKSRPMICSECGKDLDYSPTISSDTATQ